MKDPIWRLKSPQPEQWNFFQVLRWLENRHPHLPRVGTSLRPPEDPVRLGERPDLQFATSSLADVEPGNSVRPPRLNVRFFGLLGPNGPLPLVLTEFVRDRLRHVRDTTLKAFLDIFHHRFLGLFYRAWALNQKTVDFDRPQDSRFRFYTGSLLGLTGAVLAERDEVPDLAKLYYVGRLGAGVRNAEGLRAIVADYFAVPVRLHTLVGAWLQLPPENRCVLGRTSEGARLGVDTVLGARVWQAQTRFQLELGPMGWARYRQFFPGEGSWGRLVDWVRLYTHQQWEWDVRLILRGDERPGLTLDGSRQLGWSTWLSSTPTNEDPGDLILHSPDNLT